MKSTLRLVNDAVGTDKFAVLAAAVDGMRDECERLRRQVSIDEETETYDLAELAIRYGVTEKTLHNQIEGEMGLGYVIKLGKKRVIRKRKFLEYLQRMEAAGAAS